MDTEEEAITIKNEFMRDKVDPICIDLLKPEQCINIGARVSDPIRSDLITPSRKSESFRRRHA